MGNPFSFLIQLMKKTTLLLLFLTSLAYGQVTITPNVFEITQSITISLDANSSATDCNGLNSPTKVYMHSGVGITTNAFGTSVVGNWGKDDGIGEMTLNTSNNRWEITIIPKTYYGLTDAQANTITKMGMVFRNAAGSQELKDNGCSDFIFNVGSFQLTLNSPSTSTTILNSGEDLTINATTSLAANYTLRANGSTIDQKSNITNYTYTSAVTQNTNYTLEASNNGNIKSTNFQVVVRPTPTEAAVPSGMKDGINLNPSDNTKATLVFYAPGKDFVHVIGSFNNWQINDSYLLKKDSSKDRFWIELTGLTPQTDYSYQYIIEADLKVADPYSTVVLTQFNDQYIDATTYPNLLAYPTDKTTDHVTLLRTGDTPYNWQETNFQKPKKTDLVIYELLIRDFDALHSFDAVKARLDYLQDLGINAIEFMPLNEFDGNESWGYNPSFHMALDKYYGTTNAFKQLVDECHKRGIAVIVDVVFNHATGQNPYYRMWNTDNGGYQGQATAENPFFNATAQHPFNVFNDMDHSSQATKDYVKRITQYWIKEYKVDGFRYDLSKGFTQRFTTNVGVWGTYEANRIAILKKYADYQWEVDADSFVILEHFADNNEETELINYRLNEGKGMMVWGNIHGPYKEAALGVHDNNKSNFDWISYKNRGWSAPQNVSYMVSHDEERHMYDAKLFGKSNGAYNIKTEATALDRMELNGAFFFTIPGPKMIWQFDELGYDISIDQNGRTGNKPILWNYFEEQNRKDVYNLWNKLIQLKLKYDIFETSNFTIDAGNQNGLKKIQLSDASATDIQHINVIGNFGVTTQSINPVFQQTGVWYDVLNNNQVLNVTNTNSLISLAPGEFKIFANNAAVLSSENPLSNTEIMIYPNPVKSSFKLNINSNNIIIYTINGKKVKEFSGKFSINKNFNVEDLKKGFYLLEVKNNKGKTYKKLLIE